MGRFFKELARRNVLQAGAAYLVISWLILQVVATVGPTLELPEWFAKGVLLMLGLGFPMVLLVAWAYEMTPEGLKKTKGEHIDPAATAYTGQRLNYITLAALTVVVTVAVIRSVVYPSQVSAPAHDHAAHLSGDISIAVLPFADLSPSGDQDYFSDGIAEELLNVLARIDGIRVASRTSSFSYKGRSVPVKQIGHDLGVDYVLEGSVRKAAETIRITAQLIDVKADTHLMSENYDRPLTAEHVFDIQDEIAKAIVEALSHRLELDHPGHTGVGTDSFGAYDLYLKAHELFLQRGVDELKLAAHLLEQAVQMDGDFARAWGDLAIVYGALEDVNALGHEAELKAKAAAEKAIVLDPKLAAPYAALAHNQVSERDWAGAMANVERAVANEPQNATMHMLRGRYNMMLGYFDKARQDFEQCIALDKVHQNCQRGMALLKMYQQDAEGTLATVKAALEGGYPVIDAPLAFFLHSQGRVLASLQAVRAQFSARPEFVKIWSRAVHGDATEKATFLDEWNAFATEFEPDYLNAPEIVLAAAAYNRFSGLDHAAPLYWWNPYYPGFAEAGHRDRVLTEAGLGAYWRENGFPAHCQAVGSEGVSCK